MIDGKLFLYKAIRGFFEHVWTHPDAWLYWDKKVLARREELKGQK